MSQSISKKRARSVSIIICSLWLGLSGVLAQTDPAFLVQRGITDTVHSELLGEDRLIYVDFPLGYDPSSTRKYPVAFLLDGDVLLTAAGTVQDYYSGGFTPEMIIIGISNAEHRTRDLTPQKITETLSAETKDKMELAMQPNATTDGGAAVFLDFIEKELVHHVEGRYPVTDFRTLIGHSYGGLFTIYALSERPALFNYYLAIDPSMDWSGGHYYKVLAEKLSDTDLTGRAVFISMNGQLHFQDTSVTIANVRNNDSWQTEFSRAILQTIDELKGLQSSGLRIHQEFFERDFHGTIPLPSLMEGTIALFRWYQMEDTHIINNPSTSVELLKELMEYRASKLERNFGYSFPPYPEELLNMSGYMFMDMGDMEKSKMYFDAAVEYYPNSANVHDSMADYYKAVGAVDKALQEVMRANELAPSDYYLERINQLKK